jgi:hypothetical protein
MSVAVSLTFLPTLRERAREYTDKLLALRAKTPFFMNISIPLNTANGIIWDGCTAEDLAWVKASREDFDRIAIPGNLKSPFFTRVLSNITVERDGKRESLPLKDWIASQTDGVSSAQAASFKNFYCCGGTNVIFLQEDGTAIGGVCGSAQRLGNLFFDSAISIIEHMHVARCTSTACNSFENIPLPKFRHFVEAEACVSGFKERAKAYLMKEAMSSNATAHSPIGVLCALMRNCLSNKD